MALWKFPSSEDTFDEAIKNVQLPDGEGSNGSGRTSDKAIAKVTANSLSSENSLNSNKKFYDKIFREILEIMEEEEKYGLEPVSSESFNEIGTQSTYSQFRKGPYVTSTPQEEVLLTSKSKRNDDCSQQNNDVIYVKCPGPSTSKQNQFVNNVKCKTDETNCDHCNSNENHDIDDNVSKKKSNQRNCNEPFQDHFNECNDSSGDLFVKKRLYNRNNFIKDIHNVPKVRICKEKLNTCNESLSFNNDDERFTESVCERVKKSNRKCVTFKEVSPQGLKLNKTSKEILDVNQSLSKGNDCKCNRIQRSKRICVSKISKRTNVLKNKLIEKELRVVIDTPFVEKHIPIDILQTKLIEHYNKNAYLKLTVNKNVNGQGDLLTNINNDDSKTKECSSYHLKSKPSVRANKETDKVTQEIVASSNNNNNRYFKNEMIQTVQVNKDIFKSNNTSEILVHDLSGNNDYVTIHMMYRALQVGCVKSHGFLQDIIPSLKHFPVKLTGELCFKLIVEDLSRALFTYLLIGKEAEAFFGCTVGEFWNSSEVRHSVRRAIRNLLRSYKRRILNEFCLSTRNLFGSGPKYLVNVSRKKCLAPVVGNWGK